MGGSAINLYTRRTGHAADVSQCDGLTELNFCLHAGLPQDLGKMERAAGMSGIQENTLAVLEATRETVCQVFVSHGGRCDDDQIGAIHHRRKMRTDKVRSGKPLLSIFNEFDPASFDNRCERAFRARKQPDLIAAQREVGGCGAAAVTCAENGNFTDRHEAVLRVEPIML